MRRFTNRFLLFKQFRQFSLSQVMAERQTKTGGDSQKNYNSENRKTYLAMTLEEKRKLYKCSDRYCTLKNIPTWREYAKEKFQASDEADSEDGKDIDQKISVWQGDITTLEIDAIVNAANCSLLGGGGVDGAIHRAAGNLLFKECKSLRGCKVGEAVITAGYKLPAKYVVHTVGPQGSGDKELKSCYSESLRLAKENELTSIAFPCISTGIYGFPNDLAASIATSTILDFLENDPYGDKMTRVIFCIFLDKDLKIYESELLKKLSPQKNRIS